MNKKIICIFVVSIFLFTSLSVVTSAEENDNEDLITLNYSFNEPTINKVAIENIEYDKVSVEDAPCVGNPGEPFLPAKGAYILLPSNTKLVDISVIPGEITHLGSGFNIQPAPAVSSKEKISSQKKPIFDHTIYNSNNAFPEEIFTKIGLFKCKGYNILVLKLHPIKYYPISGDLYYYKDFSVKLTLENDEGSFSTVRNLIGDKNIVKNRVDNSELISTYANEFYPTINEEKNKFVIITTDELKNANGQYTFEDLKNKRISQGITSKIVTVEEIVTNPDFWADGTWGDLNPLNPFLITMPMVSSDDYYNDTAAKIRNFIRYAYMTWDTEFVLLGGDDDTIPGRELVTQGQYISDIYYACLDGSYNNYGFFYFGYPSNNEYEQVDLLAEVFVGRACVDNSEDVYNFTSKSIKYTEQSKTDPYLRNALFLGEILASPPFDDEYFYGSDYLENLIEGSDYGGYTTVGFSSEKFNIKRWYKEDNYWNGDDLIKRLNIPYYYIHIINHDGHASSGRNMCLLNSDIPRLRNEQTFFAYSSGCYSGAFDVSYYDCFAEQITVKTKYGAFAGIWNTAEGYFSDDHYDCPSIRFEREFWDAIFGENITEIGKANQDSKEDNLWRVDEKCMRKTYYELTLFGDPTISFIEPETKSKAKNNPGWKDNLSILDFLQNHQILFQLFQRVLKI